MFQSFNEPSVLIDHNTSSIVPPYPNQAGSGANQVKVDSLLRKEYEAKHQQEISQLNVQISSLKSKVLKMENDNQNLRARLLEKDQKLKEMECFKTELEALKNAGVITKEEFELNKAELEKHKTELQQEKFKHQQNLNELNDTKNQLEERQVMIQELEAAIEQVNQDHQKKHEELVDHLFEYKYKQFNETSQHNVPYRYNLNKEKECMIDCEPFIEGESVSIFKCHHLMRTLHFNKYRDSQIAKNLQIVCPRCRNPI